MTGWIAFSGLTGIIIGMLIGAVLFKKEIKYCSEKRDDFKKWIKQNEHTARKRSNKL